jgi:hypothetical protein
MADVEALDSARASTGGKRREVSLHSTHGIGKRFRIGRDIPFPTELGLYPNTAGVSHQLRNTAAF